FCHCDSTRQHLEAMNLAPEHLLQRLLRMRQGSTDEGLAWPAPCGTQTVGNQNRHFLIRDSHRGLAVLLGGPTRPLPLGRPQGTEQVGHVSTIHLGASGKTPPDLTHALAMRSGITSSHVAKACTVSGSTMLVSTRTRQGLAAVR